VQNGVELVNRAGASLNDIVDSIRKVVEIVSDISTASAAQSTGIDQVNTAVAQMDELTQQNSALVEENASSAKALEHQSHAMNERMKFFRIDRDAPADEMPGTGAVGMHRAPARAAKVA
jgi:methyl-accepting chemotaxis protein